MGDQQDGENCTAFNAMSLTLRFALQTRNPEEVINIRTLDVYNIVMDNTTGDTKSPIGNPKTQTLKA